VPLRVGLVTSLGSAAWHDVTDELRASGFGFRVTACDTRVQGEWAAEMVAAAIGTLARRALDVVVVVRGGGARSELATFDSEVVARAIARSPVPVLTGLGHEVDRSVADEVACLALKTPTACAAELVGRVRRFRAAAEEAWTAIGVEVGDHLATAERGLQMTARQAARQTRGSLAVESARLVGHAQRLPRQAGRTLARATAALDVASERSRRRAAHRLEVDSATVAAAAGRLRRRVPALARADAHTLEALESRVRSLDPARALARGWSITRTADGAIVRSTADVAPGDRITTTVADGRVHSRVEDEQERRP
jgi:exodeoxyribonuclease VII large subunit